ncbi:unnamed protein product [Rotaria sp. Silwood2]|nr:unnamed protein product [Rotaria sp. Silwood2]CAF2677944.1 unnamed protein product [Rotaria sp. Silwood2]CAF2926209.1 unnamed protein product [Rotaria sp. Silwood2]CAF3091207.1 unnamed protein product [Rotaria sp. Silwood2]CAF4300934.1 unnamed protein product [Rotaria sp. Silwood2]
MSTIRVRCLLQQCTKATLRLQDESEVTINRGMIIFVAFFKRCSMDDGIKLDIDLEFYDKLISNLRELCSQNKDNVVHAGSYGIKQIYSCQTNGPGMHIIEF